MSSKLVNLVLFVLILCPSMIFGQRMSLKEAVEKDIVNVEITDNGKSQGEKNISFTINNMTREPVDLLLNAGMLVDPVNPDLQDHVITQSMLVSLEPLEKATYDAYGMCTQGSKGGPKEGDQYIIGGPISEELAKVVKLIERNSYQDGTGQNAVWAITDRANIAGIYDESDPARSKALAEFVADVRGEDVPWYNVVYEEHESDERMFTGDVARLDAIFRYSLIATSKITFGIYHPNGEPLQVYFEDRVRPKGNHRLKFTFEATGIKHGTYHVKLFSEGVLIEDRPVEL
ncbi:MAG: hypothetical protein AAF502_17875 [Bacteroidota bacterium]